MAAKSITELLGKSIGFFDPMNGGKTEALVFQMNRARYESFNVVAYNHSLNTRERDALVINGKDPFPAKTVSSIEELENDLTQRIRRHQKYTASRSRLGTTVDMDGIPQQLGYPLRVVGIDEANLFTLTPDDAQKMISFLDKAREQKIAVFLAGLEYDFRHLPFGYIHDVLPYVDYLEAHKPKCMALNGEDKCTNDAGHTQRLWSLQFAQEQGLNAYFEESHLFNFVDKDLRHVFGEYVPAPFFDTTVRIEETKDGRIKYLPVCNTCARVPFKEETFQIYDQLLQGDATYGFLGEPELASAILLFLEFEEPTPWAERDDKGVLKPVPLYRHRSGGYARGR
ncbi:hypothetical protein HY496_02255 [Candidatus Woesearchaeota archaeon]|nr:hypothetical protein [Candidatus Woesearchaeota archaeon]